jgi:excisionase family DNA binding protein
VPAPVDPTPAAPVPAAGEGLASVKAAAEFLGGISPDMVLKLVGRGQLRAVRIGRRVLVPWAAVRLLAQQGTV